MAKEVMQRPGGDDDEATELFVAFGKRVREARKKAGLTQAQLATAVGLAQSYVHEIENYGSNITLKALAKLASSLHVSIKDLVPDNEFEAVSSSSIAELCKALDRFTTALAAHTAQSSNLAAQVKGISARVDGFSALRTHLEKLTLEDPER